MNVIIRNERPEDERRVEEITRDAFWNLSMPGCSEHYLAHVMRTRDDFVPELDYVATLDGAVVGSILYVRSRLIDDAGNEKTVLTFGPIAIQPEHQRRGVGKRLIETSFAKAIELGYDTVVIFGNPSNSVARGFKSGKKYNICLDGGVFPTALLVKELVPGALDGRRWYFHESPVYEVDEAAAEAFDAHFPPKAKAYQPSQEEFYIHSHSVIR